MRAPTIHRSHYDYEHQAHVVNQLYVKCGHLQPGIDALEAPGDVYTPCTCYGRLHAGERHTCGTGCN